MNKIFLLIPLIALFSCLPEEKVVEKIVEKVVEKPVEVEKKVFIDSQTEIDLLNSNKTLSGVYTKKHVYIIAVKNKIVALHTDEAYAQIHRQLLIDNGKEAVIYASKGEIAEFE